MLGPFPSGASTNALDEVEPLPDLANAQPEEGAKVGDASWRIVQSSAKHETALNPGPPPGLDLGGVFGKPTNCVGYSASPALIANTFVVNQGPILAFDAKDGRQVWSGSTPTLPWGSLVPFRVGGEAVVVTGDGSFFQVGNGTSLWKKAMFGSHRVDTPVWNAGSLYMCSQAFQLPTAKDGEVSRRTGFKFEGKGGGYTGCDASVLVHEGLMYAVTENGRLVVYDTATGELVYEQWLDTRMPMSYVGQPGISASPALAGKHIFILDAMNNMLVIEPGRQFKQVAKNTIVNHTFNQFGRPTGQEQILCTPVFDGGSIFIRGPECLYCVAETP